MRTIVLCVGLAALAGGVMLTASARYVRPWRMAAIAACLALWGCCAMYLVLAPAATP